MNFKKNHSFCRWNGDQWKLLCLLLLLFLSPFGQKYLIVYLYLFNQYLSIFYLFSLSHILSLFCFFRLILVGIGFGLSIIFWFRYELKVCFILINSEANIYHICLHISVNASFSHCLYIVFVVC